MEQEGGNNLQIQGNSELYRSLGRLEGKLDSLMISLNEHVKKDEAAWSRITDLEKKLVYAAGIVSVVAFAISSGFLGILKKLGINL